MTTKVNKTKDGHKSSSGGNQDPLSADFLKSVARKPGVYLMKNRQGQVIYVGKAKNLRKRLSSYQRSGFTDSPKTLLLLRKLAAVDTIITHTEKEAFILESSLIKKHRPKFNIELKDDKSYPRIKVTLGEEWPRVYMTRRRMKDGSRYFGPYSSAGAMRNTLSLVNRIFPLRRCKGRNLKKRSRPCLNFQMGRCLAPCSGKVDKNKYSIMVDNVLLFLEGRNRELRRQIKKEMQKASAALDFEKAAVLRDQLQALDKTLEKQVVVSDIDKDQDVFGYVRKGAGVGIAVINVRGGTVLGKQEFFLPDPIGDNSEVLGEVLHRFYGREQFKPADEVMVPFQVVDQPMLSEWLTEIKGRTVKLRVPRRGKELHLLEMAQTNARQVHIDKESKEKSWQMLAVNLQAKLQLRRYPARVECLDISNIGGKQPVGSLVCFIDGEKATKEYRHYSIRTAHEPDDYRMMGEVLNRRFKEGVKERVLPDLLVVDGGKGHLNVAQNVLKEKNLLNRIELISIAKDKENKSDKVYRPKRKNPVKMARHSPVLFFIMQVRDEAHRFGIVFHRRMRQKNILLSELDIIPGVGPKRKKVLLKAMGSLAAVKRADRRELAAVKGIGPELAEQIWEYFHS
ncbi:MAG: excinuclease ABC subunit UvrC [Deltaproteobacteria bacterium]|jgi:excinuclease ABC subunit C|nr:excinuclease ABC subunit UvrC [Deltaproteobacteria bacterium]